jgi:hypothetical protein
MSKARVFTDLHESAARPTLGGNDIYLDNGSGSLNSNLSGLTGWSGIPANIRQGYNTRTLLTAVNFSSIASPNSSDMRSVYLADAENGYAVGNSGALWELSSGTWSSITSPSTANNMLSVYLSDANNGYAVGVSGELWQLSGGTWSSITSPSSDTMFSVDLSSATEGYAVGVSELWQLSGGTWSSITAPASTTMTSLYLADANNGYAVGSGGALWELSSGTWSSITSPSTNTMRGIYLSDANNGYAVGDSGTLWQLSSGTWSSITSPSGDTMQSVYLSDANNGYAVGGGGALWELSDGTWSSITSPSANNMDSIYISDANIGYAVGASGTLWLGDSIAKTGTDNNRRIGWFYVDYDGSAYSVANYDGSSFNYIVTELLNAQDQTGTRKWIKWYPFTDSNGYPTSINYDLGSGAQDYCAWGVEYQNENTNGYLQNQKLVLIRDFTYPASPDDTITATVDDLLTLTSVNVDQDEYSVVRIIKGSSIVQNAVYNADSANNKPSYNSLITVEETALTTNVTNTILSNHWCEGGILGEGGSGSTDGAGAIDNIRFLTL